MSRNNPFEEHTISALYHFTDQQNIPSIQELGGLYSLAKLREMGVQIPKPGGNQWSHDADRRKGVDRYIHLCFRPNHPMEFVAREEGRIQASIFLQVHPDVLYWPGVKYTADVSNKAGVTIYSIEEAKALIDFEVLFMRTNWTDPEIQQRLQQAEKSEILVPEHIPIRFIRNMPNG